MCLQAINKIKIGMSWYIKDSRGNEYDPLQSYYEGKIAGIHNIRMDESSSDIRNANDYEESDNYAPCLGSK